MTMISAIKSFFTPTRLYNSRKVTIQKKLRPDGSLLIRSRDREGHLLKEIVREPINELKYNPKRGNRLTVGHVTTVQDFVNGTKTVINSVERKFEKAIYDALNNKEKLVDDGGTRQYFHKYKSKGNIYIDSFNMKVRNGVKSCVQFKYDDLGNSTGVKMYKIEKGNTNKC